MRSADVRTVRLNEETLTNNGGYEPWSGSFSTHARYSKDHPVC